MVQVELKVAADVQPLTTEFPRARISPSPRTDNKHPNPKTIIPQMHLHRSMSLPSASKRKIQQSSWHVKIVELPLLHYGEETRVGIRFATPVVRISCSETKSSPPMLTVSRLVLQAPRCAPPRHDEKIRHQTTKASRPSNSRHASLRHRRCKQFRRLSRVGSTQPPS
jgi:hypothetical protein